MGFQKLQAIVSAPTASAPVSMRLTKRGAAVIQIKKSFFTASFSHFDEMLWDRADVFIGNDLDTGKLRIEPATLGLVKVAHLKHGLVISVGQLAAIGPGPSKSQAASAKFDGFAIELTIPDLPQVEAESTVESGDDDEAGNDGDNDGNRAPPQIEQQKLASASASPKGETHNGVTVDLTEGNETVTSRGVTAEVTKRQAKLVYLLARARPSGSTRAMILNALWDGRPPAEAGTVLDQIVADIKDVLSPLKLAVEPKGVGYKLVDL